MTARMGFSDTLSLGFDLASRIHKGGAVEIAMNTEMPVVDTRAANTTTTAANAVQIKIGTLYDALRPHSTVFSAGARFEHYDFPPLGPNKYTQDVTSYWLSESSGTDATESNATFERLAPVSRTLVVRWRMSDLLRSQSGYELANSLQENALKVIAGEIDRAALAGDGLSNAPTGILNWSGVNAVVMGANGGPLTGAKVLECWEAVETDNAGRAARAWALTPEIAADAQGIPLIAATDTPIMADGRILDAPTFPTNRLPKTLTKGASGAVCHGLIFGDFDALAVMHFGAVRITVDPFTRGAQGDVIFTAVQHLDVSVIHPTAFVVVKDLTT